MARSRDDARRGAGVCRYLLPLVVATGAGAGAGAAAGAADPDEPDGRDGDAVLGVPAVIVRTTGRAVSCTGPGDAGGVDGATAGSADGVPGTVVAGILWITTCTGGATGTVVGSVAGGADELLPPAGFANPNKLTMPSMPVAPSPAATIRLPWAT